MIVRTVFAPAQQIAPARGGGEGPRGAYIVGELTFGEVDEAGWRGIADEGRLVRLLSATIEALDGAGIRTRGEEAPGAADRMVREVLFLRYRAALLNAVRAGTPLADLAREDELFAEHLAAHRFSDPKECGFQRAGPGGLHCEASTPDDPLQGKTTRPLCAACTFPDDHLRCTALVHPEVADAGIDGQHLRIVRSVICEAGYGDRVGDGSQCRIDGHECWRQAEVRVPAGAPSAEAPERLVDEFDHLRLALEQRLAEGLPRGSGEFRLGATLLRPVSTQDEFTGRLQALASMLDLLDGRPSARALGVMPEGAGSLVALGAALTKLSVSGHEGPIELLREVPKLRVLVPTHPIFDERALLVARFGVETPIEDYEDAWRRVADATRRALRDLRLAVQAAEPDPSRPTCSREPPAGAPAP
jgi:hypothetical protein